MKDFARLGRIDALAADQVDIWITQDRVLGRVRLAATEAGLCKVALGQESDQAFYSWLTRLMRPRALVQRRSSLIDQALAEIQDYLGGESRRFLMPLDLRGTAFQRSVWAEVAGIAYGETTTYGEIAARIGRPKAVRAVGAANGANPLPLFIPCHRVVGTDGSLRGYGGGLAVKTALLELESAAS
jgi:O-6-methylguanine DNA methyltransferase